MNGRICLLLILGLFGVMGCEEREPAASVTNTPAAETTFDGRSMEVGCGKCIYHMEHLTAHALAAVASGTPMLISGVDPRLKEQDLCSKPRKARVSGRLADGRLEATHLVVEDVN